MKLVVGLGNVGKQYEHTRHNIGWDVVEAFAISMGATFSEAADFHARVCSVRVGNEKIFLALPTTFMNLSGDAVHAIAHYYKIEPHDILIVQDEMDYAVGISALLKSGGPAGHNGILSIQSSLQTQQVNRLRIGIGRPEAPMKKEDYVLSRFSADEERMLQKEVVPKSIESIKTWCEFGIDRAMNMWNGV